jgi:hypothetical protein
MSLTGFKKCALLHAREYALPHAGEYERARALQIAAQLSSQSDARAPRNDGLGQVAL